jgi:hypothetical protein
MSRCVSVGLAELPGRTASDLATNLSCGKRDASRAVEPRVVSTERGGPDRETSERLLDSTQNGLEVRTTGGGIGVWAPNRDIKHVQVDVEVDLLNAPAEYGSRI